MRGPVPFQLGTCILYDKCAAIPTSIVANTLETENQCIYHWCTITVIVCFSGTQAQHLWLLSLSLAICTTFFLSILTLSVSLPPSYWFLFFPVSNETCEPKFLHFSMWGIHFSFFVDWFDWYGNTEIILWQTLLVSFISTLKFWIQILVIEDMNKKKSQPQYCELRFQQRYKTSKVFSILLHIIALAPLLWASCLPVWTCIVTLTYISIYHIYIADSWCNIADWQTIIGRRKNLWHRQLILRATAESHHIMW